MAKVQAKFKSKYLEKLEQLLKDDAKFDVETLEKIDKLTDDLVKNLKRIMLVRDKELAQIKKHKEMQKVRDSIKKLS